MTNFFQIVILCFAFVGLWHTFVLILANAQSKEEWKINIKYELAGILLLFSVVLLYEFVGRNINY